MISPVGSYNISGAEKSGRTTSAYTGTFTLTSPTTAQLTKNYFSGATVTLNLALPLPLDVSAATQTVSAAQIENARGQGTDYALTLQLNGTKYSVASAYATSQNKGRKSVTIAGGAFGGAQP